MNKAIKIGFIATILIYILGLTYTTVSNNKFNQQFEVFDVDKNGTINNEEITKDSQQYLNVLSKRKTTKQAAIMLIPISIFLGFICFAITVLLKKIKTIDTNEINYQ